MKYKGWSIFGSDDEWAAIRWGVQMRGNSLDLLRTMIDLRLPNDLFCGSKFPN
jgi:hypothetical protein